MPQAEPIRSEIQQLLSLGRLPSEDDAAVTNLEQYETLLHSVSCPLSLTEAAALVSLFGPDGCFGLAWTMLHLIETAPGWVDYARQLPDENEWTQNLRERVERSSKAS